MTPSERLKEIEERTGLEFQLDDLLFQKERDIEWLIARVKRLTEALEFYTEKGVANCEIARKALESDD